MSRMRNKMLAGALMLSLGAAHAPVGQGDDGRLKSLLAETCAACHGPDGNSVIPNVPKLAGQGKEYLLREMKDFKEARRHSDVMAAILAPLSDADMETAADFYAGQKPSPGVVTRPELLPLGKRVYTEGNTVSGVPSCDGCHEEDGRGSRKFPRVAGQHVGYILEELARYANDKRGTGSKIMRTVATRLTREEAEAVAEYMTSLK